jgi:hypothetical protein
MRHSIISGRSRVRAGAVIAFLLVMSLNTAGAAESFFALVFGSQSHPKLPRYTHSWVTFVKAIGEGPDPNSYALQVHSISWLPRTNVIRPRSPFPEPGVNLDLYQSIAATSSQGESIAMWGPFVIDKPSYDHSLQQALYFESGAAWYRAVSTMRTAPIYNCITAVATIDTIFSDGPTPLLHPGKPAARYFAQQVMSRSGYNQVSQDHSWLIARLGLDCYPIEFIPPWQISACDCVSCRYPR